MGAPILIDEIHFEERVSAAALSPDGSLIAVGVPGLVGLYRIIDDEKGSRLTHIASYELGAGRAVDSILFTGTTARLVLCMDDGSRRELTLQVRVEGMLQEVGVLHAEESAVMQSEAA